MPKSTSRGASANLILSNVTRQDMDLVRPYLSPIDLPLRKQLEVPHKAITHAYFVERGFASVVAYSNGRGIEVGLIGREGMTGLAIVMGTNRSPNATFIQSAGSGLRIVAADLRNAMERSATLRQTLLRYGHAFGVQAAQTALANGRSKVEERLARWLLMAHDRVDGDELALTHELLSVMLGVHRPGVTRALGILEKSGLIRVGRGAIVILKRAGLEKRTDGTYGAAEAEFKRLIG